MLKPNKSVGYGEGLAVEAAVGVSSLCLIVFSKLRNSTTKSPCWSRSCDKFLTVNSLELNSAQVADSKDSGKGVGGGLLGDPKYSQGANAFLGSTPAY